jgi:tRNA A-37 threonylcarbamoyl transferase component Bud32
MLQIAKAVNYFHTRAIILLYLSTTNIYVKEKNGIFFSDWALARTVETQDKINSLFLNNKYESLPK